MGKNERRGSEWEISGEEVRHCTGIKGWRRSENKVREVGEVRGNEKR